MAEITLIQAIFGMGNQNHEHVHRHNEMHIGSQHIDELKMEQHGGGITASTLGNIASQIGNLSTMPRGIVSVEDGWNVRRGIALLRFAVTSNALHSSELSVVGYLTGGGASTEGILPNTMFVPVRSWSALTTSVSDIDGFPTSKTVIEESSQFLMGDPNQIKDMKSLRPLDIGNEALGYLACENEGRGSSFDGTVTSNLTNTVTVSKTQNLNPTYFTRELLRLATSAYAAAEHGSLEMGIAEGLDSFGIGEMGISENPFFQAMMFGTGSPTMRGFSGYSVGEISQVFTTLPDVLNLDLLEVSNFGEDNTLLTTDGYGSATMFEIIASELAFSTVHLLLACGLASLHFSGTNNPMDFSGVVGSEDGIEIVVGEGMSVLNHDPAIINKVERFKQELKTHFFKKYSPAYAHMRTIINVEVNSFMFGETTVAISLNGDMTQIKQFTNATYMLNRTSTNISNNDVGLQEAKNYLTNVKDFFD